MYYKVFRCDNLNLDIKIIYNAFSKLNIIFLYCYINIVSFN